MKEEGFNRKIEGYDTGKSHAKGSVNNCLCVTYFCVFCLLGQALTF